MTSVAKTKQGLVEVHYEAILFLAMTNIVAIENAATEIISGINKLCNEKYLEARNGIAIKYWSRLVKIVAALTIGSNDKCCNIKHVAARGEIAARYGSSY